jgi:hypothetical protein
MNTNLQVNPVLPQTGREMLDKVMSGQMPILEFNKECAYWMTGDISTMYFKDDNTEKPEIILNLEDERRRNPKYEVAAGFWQRDDVRDYLFKTGHVRAENYSSWHWLNFMKKHIAKEDTINHTKIARAIASFPKYQNGYTKEKIGSN